MASSMIWETYLRPNTLTADNDRDCIAEVHSKNPTRQNSDIADSIVKGRSEFKRETILSILSQRDQIVKEYLCEGDSFRDGIVQISPRITGIWETESSPFDPSIHRRTLDMVMTGDMRATLDNVSVKVLGKKESSAKIASVKNSLTGKEDGTIPVGDDVIIEGDKIKIQDENDVAQGVFFVDSEGAEHRVERKLTENKPSRIIARVPADINEGDISLIIRTKAGTGSFVLKSVREIKYDYSLKAVK